MTVPDAFEPAWPRSGGFRRRRWSVRHAKGLGTFYDWFERRLIGLAPLWRAIGYRRLERPAAGLERVVKGFLFDCRMCGQCVLSATGMACPMNCPKGLRNGPCGGVRADGHCEVRPDMPCVWVEAFAGAGRMGMPLREALPAVDHALKGRSSWVAAVRRATEAGPPA